MTYEQKKSIYENIMRDVSSIIKNCLDEATQRIKTKDSIRDYVINHPREEAEKDIHAERRSQFKKQYDEIISAKKIDKALEELWLPDEFDPEMFRRDLNEFKRRYDIDFIDELAREYVNKKIQIPEGVYVREHMKHLMKFSDEDINFENMERYEEKFRKEYRDFWDTQFNIERRSIIKYCNIKEVELIRYINFRFVTLPSAIESHMKIYGKNPDEFKFSFHIMDDEHFQKMYRKFLIFNKPIDEKKWPPLNFLVIWTHKYIDKLYERNKPVRITTGDRNRYYKGLINDLKEQ